MATEAEVQTVQEGWDSDYQCLVVEVPTLEAMFAMMEAALPATAMKLALPLPKGALVGKDNEQGSAPQWHDSKNSMETALANGQGEVTNGRPMG